MSTVHKSHVHLARTSIGRGDVDHEASRERSRAQFLGVWTAILLVNFLIWGALIFGAIALIQWL